MGPGGGALSKILLDFGLSGIGIDLNPDACFKNKILNDEYIRNRKYMVVNGDFFNTALDEKVDLIISSMVIEHFKERQLNQYFCKCRKLLRSTGKIITLVPAGMRFWGIEDELSVFHCDRALGPGIKQHLLPALYIIGIECIRIFAALVCLVGLFSESRASAHGSAEYEKKQQMNQGLLHCGTSLFF